MRDLVHGNKVLLLMAGFQHDHKRRVQLIKLQDIAVRIPDYKIGGDVFEQRLQIFFLLIASNQIP